ncbi:recombinase RecT [Aurantimonas sp. DM33-3]|uniref:recombinase RecT n=1 Tax=Aurantimonas sp. DM33-3 TaxID=2766955 RepID=UPI00165207FB|nr:recombinase RecT [Aurantimonas sp. DM33-3]MBC6714731.1 recombinase RecT [Aurantimonas sp. DM33-3]
MARQANKTAVVEVRAQMGRMTAEFTRALPSHIPPERFERVVMTAIQQNPTLLECTRSSLWNSAMKAAQDGLLPDGREGAMVPYKGEVTWMPMIGGIRKKVRNSGEIATWDVQAAYENDLFEFELGDNPYIKHRPTLQARGKLIAVYSVATLKSGEKSRDVMSVSEVEEIRKKSRAQNGPWKDPTFYPEMAKKTVARRHSKVLPMSSDLDDLIRRDDHLYDLNTEGAQRDEQQERARSLAGRLDAIADESDDVAHDPNTGEIIEDAQTETIERKQKADAKPAQDKKAEQQQQADQSDASAEVDAIDEAAAAGREARAKNMARKSMPAKFRNDERLQAAWLDGYDNPADAGEGEGEEG